MIFLKKNEQWVEWKIDHPIHRFFVQRWHELFDEETYDSWQAQMSSLQTILDELTAVISVIAHTPTSHHNFGVLVNEAKAVANKDPVIRRHFNFVRSLLDDLVYDQAIKDAKRHALEQAQRKIAVIKGHLVGYDARLKEDLCGLIATPQADKNHELCHLLMALGTDLLAKGYSVPAMRDSLDGLMDPAIGDFPARVVRLIEEHVGNPIRYTCRFLVRWPKPLPQIESNTVSITDVRSAPRDSTEAGFLRQDESASILSVKVEALDPHSARSRAEEHLCGLLSLNRLYQPHKGKGAVWNCDNLALVEKIEDQGRQAIPSDASRLTYVRHARKPAQATAETLRMVEGLKDESQRDVLRSTLMYHRLFTEALSDEARLVNLWIAMEVLIPTGTGSTIDRMSDYVSTILTTEYPVSVAKALPIAMRGFWKIADKTALLPKLSQSTVYRFEVYDVLRCLTDREDGELITGLLALVRTHPLLTHKVYLLWNGTYRSPKAMRTRLEEHRMKLDWQLRRIYRARNYVMHRGRSVPGMRQLIQHLHTYYIMLVHTIIHDLRFRPEWGIAEVCESRKSIYANALKRLKEQNTSPITIDDIIMFFAPTTRKSNYIWTHFSSSKEAS